MTHWFNRAPGQFVLSSADQEHHDDQLDEHMLIIGADVADWARVPVETPHPDAGKKLRVKSAFAAPCPKCDRPCRHYDFDASPLQVAECLNGCTFIWYTLREAEETQETER